MKKMWLGFCSFGVTFLATATAFAQGAAANEYDISANAMLAAGLGIGIAAAGCAIGQGLAASSALEGIARNPNASDKIFTPMIIGLALIESLAIYALVIAFMLLQK